MAETGKQFPVIISVDLKGNARGIRVETTSREGERFVIPGAKELLGKLQVCSSENRERCVVPKVQEGRDIEVIVNVKTPDTGRILFSQAVRFVKDTTPPVIRRSSARWTDVGGGIEFTLTATDKPTTPVRTDVWGLN